MKKILFVIVVFICFILPNNVKALEDRFYEGEYLTDAYIIKLRNGSGRYQQMKMFRRVSDNTPVYCIQIWEGLNSYKTLAGYDNNQEVYANIDFNTWNKIMLIAYYGYGYGNHTDKKWYTVTQYMIWKETAVDTTLYFTDTLNGNRVEKYTNEINEIYNLVNHHVDLPSFYNNSYELKYKEKFTITDTNNVLSRYDILGTGGLLIDKSGNNLTVMATYVGSKQLSLINSDKKYTSSPIVYIDDSGQNLLAAGSYYPMYVGVNFNLASGSLIINKLDYDTNSSISQGDANLESAFQLIDNDNAVVASGKTDKDGKLVFSNIAYGDYYLKEVEAGSGYLLNDDIKKVSIASDNTSINFYNKVIKNKIIFNTYLKNPITNDLKKEDGAKFIIYDNNNEKISEFITDKNGSYSLELPYGKYLVKQVVGIKNYKYVDDFSITVRENNKEQVFNLYSERLTINLELLNLDSDSLLPILEGGASFKIKDVDNNRDVLDENNNVLILTTNDLGITQAVSLASGNYEIEQVVSVDGYKISSKKLIEINDDSFTYDNAKVTIDIINEKEKALINASKDIEYYLNDVLTGKEHKDSVNIVVYAKNDILSKDGVKLYTQDQSVCELTESNDCLLSYGDYYVNDLFNNKVIDININDSVSKHIKLLEKVYEYNKDTLIEVPDTSFKEANSYLLFIYLGFTLIYRGKKYASK